MYVKVCSRRSQMQLYPGLAGEAEGPVPPMGGVIKGGLESGCSLVHPGTWPANPFHTAVSR